MAMRCERIYKSLSRKVSSKDCQPWFSYPSMAFVIACSIHGCLSYQRPLISVLILSRTLDNTNIDSNNLAYRTKYFLESRLRCWYSRSLLQFWDRHSDVARSSKFGPSWALFLIIYLLLINPTISLFTSIPIFVYFHLASVQASKALPKAVAALRIRV